MTDDELDQIRKRCEAATRDFRNSCAWERHVGPTTEWRCGGPPAASYQQAQYDAAFIHHARTDIPALLAEINRLNQCVIGKERHVKYIRYLDDRHASHLTRLVELDKENVRLTDELCTVKQDLENIKSWHDNCEEENLGWQHAIEYMLGKGWCSREDSTPEKARSELVSMNFERLRKIDALSNENHQLKFQLILERARLRSPDPAIEKMQRHVEDVCAMFNELSKQLEETRAKLLSYQEHEKE